MNEEIINEGINEEDVLEDSASSEDILSSPESSTLEDKLDRVEALLNEEISYRENESSNTEMETGSGAESVVRSTDSGVVAPDYSQYIYDLLTDSTVKVEIVEQKTIFDKELNEYTVGEALGVIGIMLGLVCIIVAFVEKYNFKRR